jgi:hypothetical protein
MAEQDPQPQADMGAPGAYIAERHRNPAALMAQAPKAGNTWAGICAILAALLFFAAVAVMYMDWTALKAA